MNSATSLTPLTPVWVVLKFQYFLQVMSPKLATMGQHSAQIPHALAGDHLLQGTIGKSPVPNSAMSVVSTADLVSFNGGAR